MSKLRESARGEMCAVRIPGVCSHNPEETVLAHGNGSAAGKGIGMKANDLLAAFSCFQCHNVIDGRTPPPHGMTRDDVKLMFWEGHARTVRIWIEKGLLKCA